jgi:hypothetical protein
MPGLLEARGVARDARVRNMPRSRWEYVLRDKGRMFADPCLTVAVTDQPAPGTLLFSGRDPTYAYFWKRSNDIGSVVNWGKTPCRADPAKDAAAKAGAQAAYLILHRSSRLDVWRMPAGAREAAAKLQELALAIADLPDTILQAIARAPEEIIELPAAWGELLHPLFKAHPLEPIVSELNIVGHRYLELAAALDNEKAVR